MRRCQCCGGTIYNRKADAVFCHEDCRVYYFFWTRRAPDFYRRWHRVT